ncbi:hypothetical protein THICB3560264 [Thiomonas sp. CB3]|nr:hypothetical protein THICB3560264 [Thiomonas sp. CB3]
MSAPLEFHPLTLGEAIRTEWPEREFVFGPLQAGDVGLISGADGAGKFWVAGAAALTVTAGQSVCGIFDAPKCSGRVLYFAGEDRREDYGIRIAAIAAHTRLHDGIQLERFECDFELLPMRGTRLPLVRKAGDGYELTDTARWFAQRSEGYVMVVIDPMRMFHDLDESDGPGMDFFVRWLVSMAMVNKQAVLVVHHASQASILNARDDHHSGRGATDFPAGCRGVWTLRGVTDDEAEELGGPRIDFRTLVNGKASHVREACQVFLARGAGGVLYRCNRSSLTQKAISPTPANAYLKAKGKREVEHVSKVTF